MPEHISEAVKELLNKSDDELITYIGSEANSSQMNAEIAKAILQKRLSDNIAKLGKSTDRYSKILIAVSILLFIVAWTQLIVSVWPLKWWVSGLILLSTGGFIVYTVRAISKNI